MAEDFAGDKVLVNPLDISLHLDGHSASFSVKQEPDAYGSSVRSPALVAAGSPQRPGYEPLHSPLKDEPDLGDGVRKEKKIKKLVVKSETKNPRGRPRKNVAVSFASRF